MKYVAKNKYKSVHIFNEKEGKTFCNFVCDSNTEAVLNRRPVCKNCLIEITKRFGKDVSDLIELQYYFKQYKSGSSFLDSVYNHVMINKRMPSAKQSDACLKTFRKGYFLTSVDSIEKMF